jgi:hypothetical protein
MITKKDINFKNNINEITLSEIVEYNTIQLKDTEYFDKLIDTLVLLSDKSVTEIEELSLDEAVEIFKEINFSDNEISVDMLKLSLTIDGVKYVGKSKDNTITFSIKEVNLITKAIKTSPIEYLFDVAAILFQPEGVRDYSDDGINQRKELFKDTMTYDYVLPYIIKLGHDYVKIA